VTTPRKRRGQRRHKSQRAEDRTALIGFIRRGYTQDQIAVALGVTQQQVSYDYKAVLKEWRERRVEETEALVQAKLAEYAEVKGEAWAAWERSKAEVKKTRSTVTGEGSSETEEVTPQNPSSGYLAIVLQCIVAERELLGLDAPKQTHVKGEVVTQTIDWSVLARGIPDDGEVPDEVEAKIQKVLALRPVAEGTDATGVRPREADRPDSDAEGGTGR
jgi:hypothetical protein